jgi:hypothetical protein
MRHGLPEAVQMQSACAWNNEPNIVPESSRNLIFFYMKNTARDVSVSGVGSINDVTSYFYHPRHWFPICGNRTPEGKRRTGWGYAKIILIMVENTEKRS